MKRWKPVIDNSGFTEPKCLMIVSSTGTYLDAEEAELVMEMLSGHIEMRNKRIKERDKRIEELEAFVAIFADKDDSAEYSSPIKYQEMAKKLLNRSE